MSEHDRAPDGTDSPHGPPASTLPGAQPGGGDTPVSPTPTRGTNELPSGTMGGSKGGSLPSIALGALLLAIGFGGGLALGWMTAMSTGIGKSVDEERAEEAAELAGEAPTLSLSVAEGAVAGEAFDLTLTIGNRGEITRTLQVVEITGDIADAISGGMSGEEGLVQNDRGGWSALFDEAIAPGATETVTLSVTIAESGAYDGQVRGGMASGPAMRVGVEVEVE